MAGEGLALSRHFAFGAALLAASATPLAADDATPERTIAQRLETIRAAALSGDSEPASAVFAETLVLGSQSGKVYPRAAALADLGKGFESWSNDDLDIRRDGDVAVVTLINTRKRVPREPRGQSAEARFRIVQLWRLRASAWVMHMKSSVRLKDRGAAGKSGD